MSRTTTFLASGGVLLFLVAACSGSGESESGGGGDATCAEYVNALVSYADRCGDGGRASASTRARFAAACARGISAPGTTNAAAQVSACSKKLAAASCGEDVDCEIKGGTLEDGAACGERYQCKSGACETEPGSQCGKCAPRVAIGGACTSASRCVEGASCVTRDGDTGTCVATKIAKAGEDCIGQSGEIIRCDTGLHCSYSRGETICKAPGGAGSECSSRNDCTEGLSCVAGQCAPPLVEGADCNGDGCGKGLACSADEKCAPIVFVKAGEACDSNRRCENGRCKGFSIAPGPGGETKVTPGKCVDPLPDGAACSNDEGAPECDLFAACIDGKCTPADPAQCK